MNDAFAVSHRAHASVEAITQVIPVITAGFLMRNEMTFFDKAMQNPVRPLVAILGEQRFPASWKCSKLS